MSARTINFTLNGMKVSTEIEPHRNLVELLQRFDLFGARESCGQGLCGCCTVLVDDKAVSGCLYFAIWVDGKSVSTVEHLDADGALSGDWNRAQRGCLARGGRAWASRGGREKSPGAATACHRQQGNSSCRTG